MSSTSREGNVVARAREGRERKYVAAPADKRAAAKETSAMFCFVWTGSNLAFVQ